MESVYVSVNVSVEGSMRVFGVMNEDGMQSLLYRKAILLFYHLQCVFYHRNKQLSRFDGWVGAGAGVGAAVPDEGGAIVAAHCGVEGSGIEGHFRAQADFCNVSPVDQYLNQVFEIREFHSGLPRYGW